MGQVFETILNGLGGFLGIEGAKWALGDLFAYVVVTGTIWWGANILSFAFFQTSKLNVLLNRIHASAAELLGTVYFITVTLVIWGGGTYLFFTGF
ncbi:MAG: hypothetical protein AAFN63_05875 [Pseudomonadota bacterium]